MSSLGDHPLAVIGLEVISDASPCGDSVRYDPAFEQLEAELAKQESLVSETVDWSKVVDLASNIIRSNSKDILVGSYLCYGLLLKQGYPGLAVGLKILNDMAETHWDCLFPPAKRMRARQTAFIWLAEKAALIVAEKVPAANESEAIIEVSDYLKKLDNTLVEKMGDQAPMLTELSRPIKNYRQSAEAELEKAAKPEVAEPVPAESSSDSVEPSSAAESQAAPSPAPATPPPAPKPAASTGSASSVQALPSGSVATEADSKKILRQLQTVSRDIAGFWVGQKLSDPRSYRLSRVAAWMVVEVAPPSNDGVTQIIPPAAERIKFFQATEEKGDFSALVAELEKTIARSPFWLDGHFMVVKALKSLGAEYEAAAHTVIRETANFLSRLPELVDLSFSDQTPFASDQTRLWLNAEVLNASSGSGGEDSSQRGEAAAWDKALSEAATKAATGETKEAVEIIRQGMLHASQQRDQMYWRCALAQLLLNVGDASSASNILEQVTAQLDEETLSVWEPDLLSHAYYLLVQSYQKQQKKNKEDKGLTEKATKAYEKLCWFDPVIALSVKGG